MKKKTREINIVFFFHIGVDMEDLHRKIIQHSNELACLMITYPSTNGVFETTIADICNMIHEHGGQVTICVQTFIEHK